MMMTCFPFYAIATSAIALSVVASVNSAQGSKINALSDEEVTVLQSRNWD